MSINVSLCHTKNGNCNITSPQRLTHVTSESGFYITFNVHNTGGKQIMMGNMTNV